MLTQNQIQRDDTEKQYREVSHQEIVASKFLIPFEISD